MIKEIQITNASLPSNDILALNLTNPEQSGLGIFNVTGLNPSSDVMITDLSNIDGGKYTNARLNYRNIVLSMILFPKPTIEKTRQLIYRYFPLKTKIRIRFITDLLDVVIYGYVESNEIDHFSKQQTSQISILCPNPYFKSIEDNVYSTSDVSSFFNFPFSNESTTDNLIIFGSVDSESTSVAITNTTNITSGILVNLTNLSKGSYFNIINHTTSQEIILDLNVLYGLANNDIQAQDVLVIDTNSGNKSVTLKKQNGTQYNVLPCVLKESKWITIQPGNNILNTVSNNTTTSISIAYSYSNLYEAI